MIRPLLLSAAALLGLIALLHWRFGPVSARKERIAERLYRDGSPRVVTNLPIAGFAICGIALATAAFAVTESEVAIGVSLACCFLTPVLALMPPSLMRPPWLRARLRAWDWRPEQPDIGTWNAMVGAVMCAAFVLNLALLAFLE